jgi:hemoglobin
MQRRTPWKLLFCACLAAVAAAGAARADDKTKEPASRPGPLDAAIHANLREIINHGANLYNQGDWNGCYHLWEGSLMSIKPMLPTRAKLQGAIDAALANAKQDPMLWHRAWVLRTALDQVRAELKGEALGKDDDKPLQPKEPVVTPDQPKKPKTMWGRLGGEEGVTRIVDDFVNLVAPDPKVDFFRGGKYKLTEDAVVKMKRELVEQISQATGGPLKYKGPDMKKVHKGMGITDAQFNAIAADLKKALVKNKVADEDVKQILDAVGSFRKDIVEPKKPDDKKPVDTNPIDKKPVDKKPIDKKPVDKKPAATSSVTGKVIYKGKPVSDAIVTFISEGGDIVAVPAGADGSYTANALKLGKHTLTVDPPAQRLGGPKAVVIPKKYSGPRTSGLTYTVKEGKQNLDIILAD